MKRFRRRGPAVIVLLAVLALACAFRAPLLRAGIAAAIDVATGYRVSFATLGPATDASGAAARLAGERDRWGFRFSGVRIADDAGNALLQAPEVDIFTPPTLLFPIADRRVGVRVTRPVLELRRNADGSLNPNLISARKGGGGGGDATWSYAVEIADATVRFDDPARSWAPSRRFDLTHLDASAGGGKGSLGGTRVDAKATLVDGSGARFPVTVFLRQDARSGYERLRLQAARLPAASIADYFIDAPSAQAFGGEARDADVSLYQMSAGDGFHLAGHVTLGGVGLHIPGLADPATNLSGRLDFFDSGLAVRRATADLGPMPVRLSGGVIDWADPQLRIGVTSTTDFAALRHVFQFSRRLPVAGAARIDALVEGSTARPLVEATVDAPHAAYHGFPVDALRGRVVYAQSELDILPATARYGAVNVAVDGTIALGDVSLPRLIADVAGPASAVPYGAQAAPGATLHATGYLAGAGIALDAEGLLDGGGAGSSVAGLFDLDRRGDGAFGPLLVSRASGAHLAGTLYMNRRENESGFWVAADGFPAVDAGAVRLPGLPAFGPPRFAAGRLDGAVVGDGRPSNFRIAGNLRASDLQVGAVRFASAEAGVTGNFDSMQLASARAAGSWGTFAGRGTFAQSELAVEGRYSGSFERLEPFTGRLRASGPIDGPVAFVFGPTRTIVQARNDATAGAVVAGVPVGSLAGTLAVRGRDLDVLAADVGVPGATLAMAGAVRPGGGLGVSVAGADAGRLRATGSPLETGAVTAIGDYGSGGSAGPVFNGSLAVSDGRVGGSAFSGDSEVALDGSSATLRGAAATFDGAYGRLEGRVGGIGLRRPVSYDLGVHLRDLALASVAARELPSSRGLLDGTVDGDFRVAGAGGAPRFNGSVAVSDGSVNGQFVPEAAATVGYDPSGATTLAGRVRVGSTVARFSFDAGAGGQTLAASLNAPRANLADFDDLFDEGDMLGGRGRVALFFTQNGSAVTTSADLAIAKLRVRSFDLGDARAQWNSADDRVRGDVGFGGASGRLAASGTLTLASHAPLERLLQRSSFDGRADVDGLDLATWLPIVGLTTPLTGRLDADATIRGNLGAPEIATRATLVRGSFGKFPIDRFELDASSNARRTRIDRAELDMLGLHVTGAGSFGLTPSAPIALAVHASGGDIAALSGKLFGPGTFDVRGRAETDVKIGGTRARPTVVGGFDVEDAAIGGVAIPSALGEVSLAGTDLVLSGAEVKFAKGSLQLAGSLPLQLQPFSIGPSSATLDLDVAANAIDLTDFASLLPAGSTLRGQLDGRVALGGTSGEPNLSGSATLAGGVLETDVERQRLTDIAARLAFHGRDAVLERLHAEAGGGTLDATGSIRFADLAHPRTDGAFRLDATAKALRLDLPEFGFGTVDGTLAFTHTPGSLPLLSAKATVQDGVIPFAALLLAAGSAQNGPGSLDVATAPPPPGDVAASASGDARLALALTAGRNVRVRSGNVDIGGQGAIDVSGTRFAPVLSGGFDSTGGTLTYFNTLFRVQRGRVTFEPDLGVVPYLDAIATTHVSDPDPNATRNLSGFADVTLNIAGPVTNLQIGLSSDPPYDRQQILGLLLSAPQLGATSLFDTTGSIAPLGSLAAGQVNPNASKTLAGFEAQRQVTGGGDIFATTVGEEAFGVVNAQFTRNLLAPFETSFADAIGLSAVNINVDYTGSVGLTARKILGKTVNAIYSTTFGYPYRQSVGFELKPSENTAAQLTVFQTVGNEILGLGIPNTIILPTSSSRFGVGEPTNGSIGFSLSVQRLIK